MDLQIKELGVVSVWVKKGARNVGEEGHDGEDSSLLSKIMDKFNGLQTFVGERFDTFEL